MGIRESLNRNKAVSAVMSVIFVLGAIGFLIWWFHNPVYNIPTQAYYTDDGGKTYFLDDLYKVPPFDHNGKPAYRAFVYTYAGGSKEYVAYIAKWDDIWKTKLDGEVAAAVKANQPVSAINDFGSDGMLAHWLLGPTDGSQWGSVNSEIAQKVQQQKAPDGSQPEMKTPPAP